jgi:hypothetical protein
MKDQNPEFFEYYNIKDIKKYYIDKSKLKTFNNLNKINKHHDIDNKKSYFNIIKEK